MKTDAEVMERMKAAELRVADPSVKRWAKHDAEKEVETLKWVLGL